MHHSLIRLRHDIASWNNWTCHNYSKASCLSHVSQEVILHLSLTNVKYTFFLSASVSAGLPARGQRDLAFQGLNDAGAQQWRRPLRSPSASQPLHHLQGPPEGPVEPVPAMLGSLTLLELIPWGQCQEDWTSRRWGFQGGKGVCICIITM